MFTAILVYVKDLVLTGNCLYEISYIKHVLDTTFSIKDLGNLKYFLGFKVSRNSHGISLCQRKYILDLLHETCLLAAKPTLTFMDPSHNLNHIDAPLLSDPTPYQSLIGKLIYLTHLRPDICFSICRLSQHLVAPTNIHMQTTLRILHYIKTALALGMFFKHKTNLTLTGFSNSDWGSCPITRRSIIGSLFHG